MNIRYENPKEVGADRIVNAVAAIELYGLPLILVDFGTATTYDYIDEHGAIYRRRNRAGHRHFYGGLVSKSGEAAPHRAEQAERVRSAATSIRIDAVGHIFGYVGQVDGIVNRICKEVGQRPRVIATGGLAGLIAADSETISEANPLLTLTGLRILYERNVKSGGRV